MIATRWFAFLVMIAAGCQADGPSIEMTVARNGQPGLFVRVVGSGPDTTVVLHGGGLHQGYLREPLAFLEKGQTLVFVDQRGRGRSELVLDSTRLTLPDDVADLEAVRQRLDLSRFRLIGHHWGSVVAMHYAAAHPDRVSRAVLISPFPVIYSFVYELVSVAGDSAKYRALLDEAGVPLDTTDARKRCLTTWPLFFAPLKTDEGTPYERLAPSMCDAPADRLVHSAFVTRATQRSLGQWVFRPILNGVGVPVLVVEGSGEPIVEEAAQRWAQHLPDARLLMLSRPYLFPWIGDPARFRKALTTFLSGAWPDGSIEPAPWRAPAHQTSTSK